MRTITRTVELDATPQHVWEVLTDTRAHADWNPEAGFTAMNEAMRQRVAQRHSA
jgi:uncharacterized protein YndB with AHSA1/START domain